MWLDESLKRGELAAQRSAELLSPIAAILLADVHCSAETLFTALIAQVREALGELSRFPARQTAAEEEHFRISPRSLCNDLVGIGMSIHGAPSGTSIRPSRSPVPGAARSGFLFSLDVSYDHPHVVRTRRLESGAKRLTRADTRKFSDLSLQIPSTMETPSNPDIQRGLLRGTLGLRTIH